MTTWLVFAAYLALLLAVGEAVGRLKSGTVEDYLLSGRKHGVAVTAASVAATVIGAGSTLGAAGVAYYVGVSAGWYLLSAVPGLVLLAYTLAPALRRLSVYSVPEFLERRYGPTAGTVAALLGILGLVLFVAAQFYATGILLARLTPLSRTPAVLLAGAVVVAYTWRGGNWAVGWSDGIQVVWIVAGVTVVAVAAYGVLGDWHALVDPPAARGFERLGRAWFHPATRRSVTGWNPLALGNTIVAWIVMSTASHFAMQSTAQRILSSRDADVARRACLWAAALLVPLAFLFGVLGMSARVILPDLPPPPGGAGVLEQVMALPALVQELLPPLAAGVVLAALVAVIMSTCDSALLGGSTLVLRDVLPKLRGREPSSRNPAASRSGEEARATVSAEEGGDLTVAGSRRVVLVLGGGALLGAVVAPGLVGVLEMVAAVYCVALFFPLLAARYWDGATEAGAVASMAASGTVGLGWRAAGLEGATGVHMLNLALPGGPPGARRGLVARPARKARRDGARTPDVPPLAHPGTTRVSHRARGSAARRDPTARDALPAVRPRPPHLRR